MRRNHLWAIIFPLILTALTAYTLLDAFVIEKEYGGTGIAFVPSITPTPIPTPTPTPIPYATPSPTKAPTPTPTPVPIVITENHYSDEFISIDIETVTQDGYTYYAADIKLTDIKYFQTAFAKGKFGKNITQKTSVMAEENNAIFAVNGDYYGFRDNGLIIRNGVLYRDNPRAAPGNLAVVVDWAGDFSIVAEGEVSGEDITAGGQAYQSFSFGPALLENGEISEDTKRSKALNPRTAIGQAGPLHYVFIVVDGRTSESRGVSVTELANIFLERGCTVAYNLDGGGSSCMWFNGRVVNNPADGNYTGERNISDILFIPAREEGSDGQVG
jgi:exopolysaccharide biosynthesis protein